MSFEKYGHFLNCRKDFVEKDEFIGEYATLFFKNGGDWCRHETFDKTIYKCATMKANGKINFLWSASDIEKEEVTKNFRDNFKILKGNNIKYFKIFGIKTIDLSHPICKKIKDHYKKMPCVNCGSNSDLQCDHKNGLYNNPRVLDIKTQLLDDFQSLCRHCNDQKRQVEKKIKETGIRYGATNIPSLKILGIDFIEGDETYNCEDINALKGTYWYDPIEFMKQIKIKLSNQ